MSSPRSRQFVVRPARFHLVFVALLLLSGITACNRQPDADSVSTTTASPIEPAPDEATPRITSVGVDGFPRFALGIEYMELGLAEAYAPMGIRWAKTRLEAFSWGISEPEPPLGDVHRYDWSLTDALIGRVSVRRLHNHPVLFGFEVELGHRLRVGCDAQTGVSRRLRALGWGRSLNGTTETAPRTCPAPDRPRTLLGRRRRMDRLLGQPRRRGLSGTS